AFGVFNLTAAFRKSMTASRANRLALAGHLAAAVAFYLVMSRFVMVSYMTDTMVATQMGVVTVLRLQSPYLFSIKPLLDQFGFSPSFYTPGVDGSFDFRLAYPSLSFLSLAPFYAGGVHDLRDVMFLFHIISVLLIFGLVPKKFKAISLAPFSLFAFVIAGSWTDSVWAFFLALTAFLWYRNEKASWVSVGMAVAVKQLAVVIVPFLLIRHWKEASGSKIKASLSRVGLMLGAFFLPNAPFIIASPGAWWNDVVVPYLPSSPAQIPGGVGLSNFLLDLGIALPSTFYLVLMVGVSTILLCSYARHYRGLNSSIFAFPILMFFLYYRSFPNYMAYWLFPLVLDICRLGGPNLHSLFSIRLPTISWQPTTRSLSRLIRQKLTPSLMALMTLTIIFAGVSGAYISQASTPKSTIQISGVADPDSIGEATAINVTLRNLLTTPVSPTFFVKFAWLTYLWNPGPNSLLQSGNQATYEITAPDALSAVPEGATFHIIVYDGLTGRLLGESLASKATIPTPPIVNPSLKWWALEPSVGKKIPFGWKFSPSNTDLASSRVNPLGYNGTSGFQMMLNYTSTGRGNQQMILSQKTFLNDSAVSLHFNQSFTTSLASGTFFAAGVTDGTHTLYYVFSNFATQRAITQFSGNTTIIVPTTGPQWNNVTLNPQTDWIAQDWTLSQQVTVSFFLASESPGIYYTSISSIDSA
ncbi:MAG TPA: hypothetical protein VE955_08960, partial [Candidatus Dormibacteraeota bacterium]|nr:hypothetical protein [Candidatus Dormibacteraeota bacterium]